MRLLMTNGSLLSLSSAHHLRSAGFGVDHFNDPEDVGEAMTIASYDLALLECTASLDWTAWLKRHGRPAATGFIMLVAEEEERRIAAYEAGADDCLANRVSGRELVARIRAILRRPRQVLDQVLQAGNLALDCTNKEVSIGGAFVPVPPRELRVLELVMRKPGRIVTRSLLESDLYGACMEVGPNSIETRVSCLRRRLAEAGADVTVRNVRGIGYKMTHTEELDPTAALKGRAARPEPASRLPRLAMPCAAREPTDGPERQGPSGPRA